MLEQMNHPRADDIPRSTDPPASAATFAPDCLICQYDISATPDGRCPECGGVFTHDELYAAARLKARQRPGVLDWTLRLIAGPLAFMGAATLAYASWSTVFPLSLTLILAGVGLLALVDALRRARGHFTTWLTTFFAAPFTLATAAHVLNSLLAPFLLALIPTMICWRRRVLNGQRGPGPVGAGLAGLTPTATSCVWTFASVDLLIRGYRWSRFD